VRFERPCKLVEKLTILAVNSSPETREVILFRKQNKRVFYCGVLPKSRTEKAALLSFIYAGNDRSLS